MHPTVVFAAARMEILYFRLQLAATTTTTAEKRQSPPGFVFASAIFNQFGILSLLISS
jgi:hypothetical protein